MRPSERWIDVPLQPLNLHLVEVLDSLLGLDRSPERMLEVGVLSHGGQGRTSGQVNVDARAREAVSDLQLLDGAQPILADVLPGANLCADVHTNSSNDANL